MVSTAVRIRIGDREIARARATKRDGPAITKATQRTPSRTDLED